MDLLGFSISFGEVIGLVCAFIWALNGLVMRTQVHKVPPALLNSIRCGAAAVFVWMLLPFGAPLSAYLEVSLQQWALLVGSVLIAIGIGDTLYLAAIKEIGVSRTLALVGIHPLTTLFFEWLFLEHIFDWRFVLGCCLVVAGVIGLSTRSQQEARAVDEPPMRLRLGVFLALASALFWGLGTVMTKPAIAGLTPVQANSIRMPLVALVLYLPRYWYRQEPGLRQLEWRTLLIVAGVGVLGMGLGSLLFLKALDLIGPAKTTTLSSVSPVFGLVMAVLFLKEKVSFRIVLGAALCVSGVWLVL